MAFKYGPSSLVYERIDGASAPHESRHTHQTRVALTPTTFDAFTPPVPTPERRPPTYTTVMPRVIQAVVNGAAASHAFVTGSYRSTELRMPSL